MTQSDLSAFFDRCLNSPEQSKSNIPPLFNTFYNRGTGCTDVTVKNSIKYQNSSTTPPFQLLFTIATICINFFRSLQSKSNLPNSRRSRDSSSRGEHVPGIVQKLRKKGLTSMPGPWVITVVSFGEPRNELFFTDARFLLLLLLLLLLLQHSPSLSLSRSQFQAERVVCRSWEERTGCVNGLATIQRKCGSLGQPMGAGVATRGWQRSLPRRPSLFFFFFFFFFVRGSLLVLDHRIVSRSFYPLVRGCESWTWQARPSPSIRPLTLLLRWTGFLDFWM